MFAPHRRARADVISPHNRSIKILALLLLYCYPNAPQVSIRAAMIMVWWIHLGFKSDNGMTSSWLVVDCWLFDDKHAPIRLTKCVCAYRDEWVTRVRVDASIKCADIPCLHTRRRVGAHFVRERCQNIQLAHPVVSMRYFSHSLCFVYGDLFGCH